MLHFIVDELFYRSRVGVCVDWRREQEAARQDPDNAEYRILIRQYKLMESTKEAGNKAFKAHDLQVRANGIMVNVSS